jgi:tetratricopeptide (TPR) repeat protein
VRIESRTKLALASILLMTVFPILSFAAAPDYLGDAQSALSQGRADDALRALDAVLQQSSENAAAWNLQCRVYLAQGRWDDAIGSCQRGVQIAADNSDYHLWLGRAYGEKASRSALVTAYQMAKRTHSEFEVAVALDANNPDALSDLGEYDVEAPRMLGGGREKAETIVSRLDSLDPARADELRARIAEAKKNYPAAEQQLRARISASQSSPDAAAQAWMDLGSFYRKRGRFDEMVAALKSGAAADTVHGPALVDGASTLIAARREPDLASQWLREYLEGNALSEAAPAFAVHAQLGDLLKKQGDAAGAEREIAAARALSANYARVVARNTGD